MYNMRAVRAGRAAGHFRRRGAATFAYPSKTCGLDSPVVDPYRTSVEGQRVRAEEAKKQALREHDRLTRFLLAHLDRDLVERMAELRETLDGESPGDDATIDFWIDYEGRARALSEAVGRAIAAASELRGELGSPRDAPDDLHVGSILYGGRPVDEREVARALPPDATDVELATSESRVDGTFRWSGHPMRLTAVTDEALTFVVGTGVPVGGPKLEVGPSGLFHSNATGDEAFDSMYAVRGSDEAIATWLGPAVRKALLAIARVDPARVGDVPRCRRAAPPFRRALPAEDGTIPAGNSAFPPGSREPR